MPQPIIDISHHQSPDLIDYDRLAEQIDGVIIRAAYGSKPDTAFERHYAEFHKRNVPIGVYQFITEYMPVEEQVQGLYKMVMQDKHIPLGFWVDVENETGADPLTKQTVHAYMQQAEALLGKEFGIYTSASQWATIMGGAYYTNRKLWVAHYGATYPTLPKGWTSFWLWQYTSSKRLEGYAENLDANAFGQDDATFNNWVSGVSLPAPEPLRLYSPVNKGSWISQRFGINPQWYSAARGHNGIDYGIIVGEPVYCAIDGTVEVSTEVKGGYGRHIRIRHVAGVTIYGHLSQRFVQVGEIVTAKQLIGRSGGALTDPYCGYSTGPHLHFEYRQDAPVVPLVPGSYVYNAINTLPFTIDWEEPKEELGNMLFQVEVIAAGLNVREGIGTQYDKIRTEMRGAILSVYEVTNGWYRIGVGEWVSGNSVYSKKLVVASPPDNRLDKLWEAHPELH